MEHHREWWKERYNNGYVSGSWSGEPVNFAYFVNLAQTLSIQGKVFSASWSPDDVLTLAAGGSKGMLQIWDVSTNAGARKTMAGKVKEAGRALREKTGDGVIGVVSDNEDDSEEDE